MLNKVIQQLLILFTLFVFSFPLWAGFIEMPEITEMPELERKSMLKDLSIPNVRDRDPDPDSGPRLNVEKFKLQGIVEYPELGISKEDIDKLIESIRFELMQEYNVEKSGFTKHELEEVSDLLIEIEEDTVERHVTDLEVQKLVWLIREQRSNRGITLGTIETVADRITQFYRERGFILAKAYIPRQEVRDGVVTLTLLLGILGEVEVHDNTTYTNDAVSSVFDDMLAKPVTSSAVEENLYLINDFPGILATGFFQPGAQVGDTKLNISVKAEKTYDINLRFDNHGSEQTGEYRVYAEAFLNNPLGNADQLQLATLATGKPSNSNYYQFRYSSQLLSPRFRLSVGASSNDFVLGPGNSESIDSLGIFGDTIQADITASYSFKRSRVASYYGDIVFDNIKSRTRLGGVSGGADDNKLDDTVNNLSFVFRYDILDESSKILHQGDVRLLSGKFVEGADEGSNGGDGQDESYYMLNATYSLLTFQKVPFFDANSRIIYRAAMQYSGSALSSINQYSLAGPARARAYPVNQFSADNALYGGVDWIFTAPQFLDIQMGASNLRRMISPVIFMDFAWGQVFSIDGSKDDSTGQLLDAGFGFQFSYINNFQGNFQLAFPLSEKFTDNEVNPPEDSFKLVLDFQYSFR